MCDRTPLRRELTAGALARLLEHFSAAPDEAAARYNGMRSRLVQFFRWERCDNAEDLADEVVNRVARRITEGEEIGSLPAYFLGVARRVVLEARERRVRDGRRLEEYSWHLRQGSDADRDEAALECLDGCLAAFTPERRDQLLSYYTDSQGARIERRRQLAEALGVRPIALRNRMLRMRQRLESCLDACLSALANRDESAAPDTYSKRARGPRTGDEA